MRFFQKIKKIFKNEKKVNQKYELGLQKSRKSLKEKFADLALRHRQVDEEYFEDFWEVLINYDVGVAMANLICEEVKLEVKRQNITNPELIEELTLDKMFALYTKGGKVDTTLNIKADRLNVFLVIGVNGSGKTTSVAKIAQLLKAQEFRPLLVAADTFRAGAVEQLTVWAERLDVPIVKPQKVGQDPAAVVFQGLQAAKANNSNVLLIDTAGRLQNKVNLMNELAKIHRVIKREIPSAPHESLLTLDATTGQNGLSQADNFNEIAKITGIILTKMDGTSKGGIILAIRNIFKLPVKLLGLGEKLDDLQEFDLDQYLYSLVIDLLQDSSNNTTTI